MKVETETREEKFRRLAERRVNAIIDKLRLLGHLANKSNYSYTNEQVDAIFKVLQKDLNAANLNSQKDLMDRSLSNSR